MSLAIPKVWKQINDFDKFLYKFGQSFDNFYHRLETDFGVVAMAQNFIWGGSDWTLWSFSL